MIQHDDLRILIIPIESCAEPFYHLDQSSSGICWDLTRVRRLHCYWPSAHSIVSWTFRMQSLAASSLQSHFIIIAQQIITLQGSLPMRTNATHALQLIVLESHQISRLSRIITSLAFITSTGEFLQELLRILSISQTRYQTILAMLRKSYATARLGGQARVGILVRHPLNMLKLYWLVGGVWIETQEVWLTRSFSSTSTPASSSTASPPVSVGCGT